MKKSMPSNQVKGSYTAILPFLLLLIIASAVAGSIAGINVPSAGASTPGAPYSEWTSPRNVANSPYYDNGPEIAASPLDGAATIGWEVRDIGQYPDFNEITQASNTTFNGPFNRQTLQESGFKLSGAVQTKHDSLGRRHMIWYHNTGTAHETVCNYYSVVGLDGRASPPELLPSGCGGNRKMSALAIGPDNSVHILFGWIGNNIRYWQRSPAGAWTVVAEELPEALGSRVYPEAPTLGVTTNGVIIAGWKDASPSGSGADIFTAVRNSTNNWTVEDISYNCCEGCPTTSGAYTPSMAPDKAGGMRIAWGDEQCPRGSLRKIDLYHRQWVPGTGWNNQPIVRVFRSSSEAYDMGLAIDDNNQSHIVWSDDTGRPYKNTTFFYSTGSGTTFTAPTAPFAAWSGNAYIKEPSVDYAFGGLHASFSSIRDESNKDNYYVHLPLAPRCPQERFSDVCPGDTFYTYIMNLVNLGVISGYADGTFRPNNNLTRGQAAKIVALAANLPANLQGAPHFTDVPPDNTFYNFIEFSYNAGVIGGYPCGGPGEPCDGQQRAYFRPGNNITRGQISKMTSQAFGFNEPVSGQTFSDVPPSNSFYVFIERMARRGIISGYSDGTFRPNTEVTRGQASKIVDGARQQPTATPLATSTPTITATFTATPIITVTLEPTLTIVPTITITLGPQR